MHHIRWLHAPHLTCIMTAPVYIMRSRLFSAQFKKDNTALYHYYSLCNISLVIKIPFMKLHWTAVCYLTKETPEWIIMRLNRQEARQSTLLSHQGFLHWLAGRFLTRFQGSVQVQEIDRSRCSIERWDEVDQKRAGENWGHRTAMLECKMGWF